MNKKKLSIIIPTYNEKDNLGFALFMLYKQTVNKENIEIIIIDDCSTDNYDTELQLYRSKGMNIKCIRNQENMGAGVSRQIGVDIAIGEWVCFMDADDMITPNYCEKIISNIEKYPNIKVFTWLIFNEKLKAIQKCYHLGSYAIKKEFLIENKIKFHDKLRLYEDDYYVNIIVPIAVYNNEFKMIPDVLYQYKNTNEKSTTHKCGLKESELEAIKKKAKLDRILWFLDNKPEILENYNILIEKTREVERSALQ